jgi:tRNA threonylcarbamoyladenosine biosynthesis protein TsaB
MRILAFDGSTSRGCVAVVENGSVLYEAAFDFPRGRGGELFLRLDDAVARTGRPGRIVVGIGPGSYNGIRAAIAAAAGLRLATRAELVGVCSIRALGVEEGDFFAIGDARGGSFFLAKLDRRRLTAGPELLTPEALRERLEVESTLPVYAPALLPAVPRAAVAHPSAVVLAQLGAQEPPADAVPEPIYLKPAHITKPKSASGRG